MFEIQDTTQEVWKPIPGYEGYEVSSLGSVKSLPGKQWGRFVRKTTRILLGSKDKDGYHRVEIAGKTVKVHRLVLLAFHGPCNGLQSRHLNGKNDDNRSSNLRWGTAKENGFDKIVHGTTAKGELCGRAKLTEAVATDIIRLIGDGRTHKEIADSFGVSESCISIISQNKSWTHLSRST